MKKLLLLAFAALSINAYAQYNLDWTATNSISGGEYKSQPVGMSIDADGNIYTASNDFCVPIGALLKGVVTKYDKEGTLLWSTVLPNVDPQAFPPADRHLAGLTVNPFNPPWIVAYNTEPTSSHLIKINPNGGIDWDIVLNAMNNVVWSCGEGGSFIDIYVVGRTPQGNCGGYPCNGLAIAKYNTDGQHLWTRTMYTSNFRIRPTGISTDAVGNTYVCGKKATVLSSPNYNQTFVIKYAPNGNLLWVKEFNATTTESTRQIVVICGGDNILFGDADGNAIKLRMLSGANGALLWTKSINNSKLNGFYYAVPDFIIIATTTGMRAYNASGNVVWSNNLRATNEPYNLAGDIDPYFIATNVSPTEPLSNYLVQLDASLGDILSLKNLSFGNHEEYMGDYAGIKITGSSSIPLPIILINDTTPPYGTRVTKLSPCSNFTYAFVAAADAIDVSGGNCNDGQINVSWTGTFNSWPYIELFNSSGVLLNQVFPGDLPNDISIMNLSSGNYTVKVFDESCGEQEFDVTVRCPVPTGLSTTNITRNKAHLNWTLPSCNDGVQLQYRLQGALNWTIVNTNASYKQINGLTPNSLYEWRVASKCSGSSPAVYSDFSAVQTFSTPAQRITVDELTASDELPEAINIYPNPSSQKISFSLNSFEGTVQLQIVNVLGQQVIIKQVQLKGGEIYSIDISSLAQGSYQLILSNDTGSSSTTFVKE